MTSAPSFNLNGSIPLDAYVLLIGAMKCGTTSLFSYLQAHPQICCSRFKEPEFFLNNANRAYKVSFYEDLWDFNSSRHKYALEGSTGYTKYPHEQGVVENIYRSGIKPKFIYVIRNPFDRIESHLNHMMIKQQENRRLDDKIFIDLSNYYKQLGQYKKFFPKENFFLLDYNLLDKNPAEALQSIYQFLGFTEEYFPVTYDRKNTMKPTHPEAPKKPHLNEVEQRRIFDGLLEYSVAHSLRLSLTEEQKEKIFHEINQNIMNIHTKIFNAAVNIVFLPPDRPKLTETEREIIHNALYQDMQKLQAEFGVDVKERSF